MKRWFLLTMISFITTACSDGTKEEKVTYSISAESGLAIQGYDPVSYFTEKKAVKGSETFSYEWQGAQWHFSNSENMEKFKSNPTQFAPQFGGFCAFASSLGKKESASPETWSIVDGKLYFNKNGFVRFLWNLIPGRIPAAEKKWSQPQ